MSECRMHRILWMKDASIGGDGMEKWKRYVIGLVVALFMAVGYMFASKQPETPMVEQFELKAEESVQAEPATGKIVVYVTGAVVSPDVYEMPPGARVGDVLTLAVLTADAEPEQLNLAQLLVDGSKITVPKKGELLEVAPETTETETNGVHVNSATKEELMTVPGIGPAKAEAILNYLKEHGPFKSYEELRNVKGFGEKTLENMKGYLLVP